MRTVVNILAGGLFAATMSAHALDITGAGASFPAPVYAKWAEAYKAESGNAVNYQAIGSGGAPSIDPISSGAAESRSGKT